MELGMIGLGRMGANMAERLLRGGHRVAGHDRDAAAVRRVEKKGAAGADALQKLFRLAGAIVELFRKAADPGEN